MPDTIHFSSRTHFKVLFVPALVQLGLIALHVIGGLFIPTATGWDWWDSWILLIFHSLLVLVAIWYAVIPLLRWLSSRFEVTDETVASYWGILYKHSREIPLKSIVSTSVERGILDRIFGCGTITFLDAAAAAQPKTSGAWNRPKQGQYGVNFRDVPRVLEVKQIVDSQRRLLRGEG